MRSLTSADLLDVWEQGLGRSNVHRALLLMAKAFPQTPQEELALLSISQRDSVLLALREKIFGSKLDCKTTCPDCGELLELTFGIGDIRAMSSGDPPKESSLIFGDYHIDFRLPNSFDLLAIEGLPDVPSARQTLIKRCLIEARLKGESSCANLPSELEDAISHRMAEVDPTGDVQLEMACPVCSRRWTGIFDITSFFWSEIHAWAHRILREVHLLASSYSWNEAEILSMSQMRRQIYIEMASE
jgi:hypothetical protein